MKKVCIFAEFPLSALSGESSGRGGGQAATWLPQLAKAWESNREFEIHWAVFDRSAINPETISAWNQTFHRIPCPGISASMLLGRLPHRRASQDLLNRLKPDLIHCWGTENLNGSALCEFKGPSILSMQGIITTYFKTGDLKGWRWKLFRHWEPISIRKASLVTSESQWGLARVDEIVPGKPTRRIEYGVSSGYYEVEWTPDPRQPRFLFVGGLNRLKGIDLLLEMLRHHPKPPWKMVFAGAGYLGDALLELNDSSVEVLGMLTTAQVQTEMSKAWALVLPSRADTSPNVVKEARVIGLPVIVSPHGGHAVYVEHRKDGILVESNDPAEWFKVLDSMSSDFERCRAMGIVRNEFFREHFRPEATAREFLNLYRDVSRSGGR